jgi:tRNA nucleotidyltransferase (CCA-adding enzyme)
VSSTKNNSLEGLEVYIVGGAVRDRLLGLPEGDKDWVVVGAAPEDMTARGFLPVGGDFPVFLHPQTREEYALARTERKSGRGYQGFTFYTGKDVSLEDDLKRRDLTINAMAQDREGNIIDPLNGQADLQACVFRHVGDAFIEDPVRILRVARFAARFTHFSLADETRQLCRQMVDNGEVDALVPERVWKEISRGMLYEKPSKMFNMLADVSALPRVMPQLVWNGRVAGLLDAAHGCGLPLPSRYAILCLDTPDIEALSRHLRVPNDCLDYARLLPLVLLGLQAWQAQENEHDLQKADDIVALIERCDGLRKPERFMDLIQAAACAGKTGFPLPDTAAIQHGDVPVAFWRICLERAKDIDAGAIAREYAGQAAQIKEAVRKVRVESVYEYLIQS